MSSSGDSAVDPVPRESEKTSDLDGDFEPRRERSTKGQKALAVAHFESKAQPPLGTLDLSHQAGWLHRGRDGVEPTFESQQRSVGVGAGCDFAITLPLGVVRPEVDFEASRSPDGDGEEVLRGLVVPRDQCDSARGEDPFSHPPEGGGRSPRQRSSQAAYALGRGHSMGAVALSGPRRRR